MRAQADEVKFPAEWLDRLREYRSGSRRSVLFPIEQEVRASFEDPTRARRVRAFFRAALKIELSPEGFEFVCRQLTLIGAQDCWKELVRFIEDGRRCYAACLALQTCRDPDVVDYLIAQLRRLRGESLIAAITLLGDLGAERAVSELAKYLVSAEPAVAEAAALALGRIGGSEAFQALAGIKPERFSGRSWMLRAAMQIGGSVYRGAG